MDIIRHKPQGSSVAGPYFPAVEIKEKEFSQLFVSGQGTKNPLTGERVLGAIEDQTVAVMDNLKLVIEGCGFSMARVVKVTIFLTDMNDFEAVNEIYRDYFPEATFPARSTVAVKDLPGGQSIEVDAVVVR
jgi:2-iminobutanoate/2-iminopropanoate deaminase